MIVPYRITTIESVFDRFGGYRPIFVGNIPTLPHITYVDGVLASNFVENELYPTAHLLCGDMTEAWIPDNFLQSFSQTGVQSTAVIQRVISTSVPCTHHVKCPECGQGMVMNGTLWCENVSCRGRLVGRLLYLSSPEGLNYPWNIDRSHAENFLHHMQFRSLAEMFDPTEISIADSDLLPSFMIGQITGWLLNLRSMYQTAPPEGKQMWLSALLLGLSYPGIDMSTAAALVRRAFAQCPNSPCRYIAQGFFNLDTMAALFGLNLLTQAPLARFMLKQLSPFHREIARILGWLSDEAMFI